MKVRTAATIRRAWERFLAVPGADSLRAVRPVREHPGKSHNQYLSMAAETGVPGALLFVVLLAWLARRLPVARPEGLGALGALAFFVLLGLLHDPFFHVQASQAFALVLGAGFSGPPAPSDRSPASARHSPPT